MSFVGTTDAAPRSPLYDSLPLFPEATFPDWDYEVIHTDYDPELGILRVRLAADGVPSFTTAVARDLSRLCRSVRRMLDDGAPATSNLRYAIMSSDVPGIFSMGGDLAYFADCIDARDHGALTAYAHNATDVFHAFWTGFGHPVVTIALVEGDALGGGFEAALVHNVIVAERGHRLGLPETTFNIFPGMGAVSFLPRRIGEARTKRIVLAAGTYRTEQMHEWGGVDHLVEAGGVEAWVTENLVRPGRPGYHAMLERRETRARSYGIARGEMLAIVDAWVAAAMKADASETNRMRRVAALQRRQMRTRVDA